MPDLYYFYPQNDGALADNTPGYMATRTAIALAKSGATTALWLGRPGDRFICDGVNAQWLDAMRRLFGLRVDVWNGNPQGFVPAPWGWSLPVRRLYRELGFPADSLPDDRAIERIRMLSHRRTAAALAAALHKAHPDMFCPPAVECTSVDSGLIGANTVVKQPWSSSGRGVLFGNALTRDDLLRQAGGMIRRQGSVMVEPLYDNVVNFSILFRYSNGRPELLGVSAFDTDSRGGYTSSLVAAQPVIAARLRARGVDADIARMPEIGDTLTSLFGTDYNGLLGIDMMALGPVANGADRAVADTAVADAAVRYAVAEINLRTTMGHVALALGDKLVEPDYYGRFAVSRRDGQTACLPSEIPHSADFAVRNHRVVAGSLLLNPPECAFSFTLTQTE